MKLKIGVQPKELQQQLKRVFVEGNDARVLLHKKTVECTTIFNEVSEWMGVITHHNQALEDLRIIIHTLNEKATKTHDPLEQEENFD
jgi:hypothetical protein